MPRRRSRRASASGSSAATAPASRRCSTSSAAPSSPMAATSSSSAARGSASSRRRRPAALLVSHARGILNAVATHILHLEAKKLILYPGHYDAFVRTRRERIARERALASQQAQRRQQLQGFIDRFRAKASKARQAQS